jgi:predicted phosphodiesterase
VERKGVIYLNPGSAGRQGANVPASAALMGVDAKRIKVRFIEFRK